MSGTPGPGEGCPMTTTNQPTVHPHGTSTAHRALAAVTGLAFLGYAAGAVWATWATHHEIVTATPDQDTSLYGLGYLFAMFLGGAALLCGMGGAVGWFVARRHTDAGTTVLAVAAALSVAPVIWWLGLPGSI